MLNGIADIKDQKSIDRHSLYYLGFIIIGWWGDIGISSLTRNHDAQSLCTHCKLMSFLNYVLIDGGRF